MNSRREGYSTLPLPNTAPPESWVVAYPSIYPDPFGQLADLQLWSSTLYRTRQQVLEEIESVTRSQLYDMNRYRLAPYRLVKS